MKKLSYEKALSELQEIIAELQQEAVSIDDLTGKVERAAQLIRYCKDKLRQTEQEISDVLSDK